MKDNTSFNNLMGKTFYQLHPFDRFFYNFLKGNGLFEEIYSDIKYLLKHGGKKNKQIKKYS